MSALSLLIENIAKERKVWLLTGAAGFIGSHLLETLLRAGQSVIAIDNFSTGHQRNLDVVRDELGESLWKNFTLVVGDVADFELCKRTCSGVDYVLHQAALASVQRSIENPFITNKNNVDGFLSVLQAAREAKVKRFVYASSSSVYGDHPSLPKVESSVGNCLSPYALTKKINELYADLFAKCYGIDCVGLRYFNVFGPRQDPAGPYAAVIPKWASAMIQGQRVYINGDGETSRDFCFVANVIQANLLAATTSDAAALNQNYNIASGNCTTLNVLFELLRSRLLVHFPHLKEFRPIYRDFLTGDVRHSHANIDKARELLAYHPSHDIRAGLTEALDWYVSHRRRRQ